jgi:hypothetical protein
VSDVLDALFWNGSEAMISLFLLTDQDSPPELNFTTDSCSPDSVRSFTVEDEAHVIGELNMYSYDLVFEVLPPDALGYLEEVLRRTSEEGRVAWLGFEGHFHFDHLLTDDMARHVYGVCGHGGTPHVVLDQREMAGPDWVETIRRHRRMLGLAG